MKLKNEYVLQQVADVWVVLPIGEEVLNFNSMITLNETGAFLWKKLAEGADMQALIAALTSEYDVTAQQAQADTMKFCQKLHDAGCMEL